MYNVAMQAVNYLDLLPEILWRILSVSAPEKVILFGSYARGDFNPDSDLDLMVIMKNITSPRSEGVRLRRALRGLLVPVDLIVSTPEQVDRHEKTIGLIYQSAISEGKVIYDRTRTN